MISLLHVTDEQLEMYAVGRLSEPEVGVIEEHLLICSACQQRLMQEDEFFRALRGVGPEFDTTTPRLPASVRWRWPAVVCAGAAATAAGIMLTTFASRPAPLYEVTLETARGLDDPNRTRAGLIRIHVDTTQLQQSSMWNVQVVNAAGARVWEGTITEHGRSITAEIGKLRRGQYWVRVVLPGAEEPVREFSLRVE
jgi:hypothetical protein